MTESCNPMSMVAVRILCFDVLCATSISCCWSLSSSVPSSSTTTTTTTPISPTVTHGCYSLDDIRWKIRPRPDTPWIEKIQIAVTVWATLRMTQPPPRWSRKLFFPMSTSTSMTPTVLVLEAWNRQSNEQFGFFGLTVQAGPSTMELETVVSRLTTTEQQHQPQPSSSAVAVAAAAIVYMYVEPHQRSKGLGGLALQVIAYLHRQFGCDYTILIANDKSDRHQEQTLVRWYESHGYHRAPELQDLLGSPNERYGVAMIAPAMNLLPNNINNNNNISSSSFTVQCW